MLFFALSDAMGGLIFWGLAIVLVAWFPYAIVRYRVIPALNRIAEQSGAKVRADRERNR